MDHDPDVPLPSIERHDTPTKSFSKSAIEAIRYDYVKAPSESSPSRTPFKTPRSRPATPGSSPSVRSPSVASTRSMRSTPTLDKKRSLPNLNVPASAMSSTHQPQFRRTSSNLNPDTPNRMRSVTPGALPERKRMTPSSVAQEYFQRELALHERRETKTLVFTHHACYGHRFSRQKSSKATIASIVERPERIHATLLGASTAYVRLGGRHKDGGTAPHPDRSLEGCAFPFSIRRSTRYIPLDHPAVVHVHGNKWMTELQLMCDSAEARLAIGAKELQRPIGYGKDEKGNKLPELHPGDLYLAKESLAALQGCLGGVCDAVDAVMGPDETRRAFVCIRPPGHHCSANMPSGFCWLNNVHVGISYAAMNHGLTHAAIIDFDLHHGDGSQAIAWSHNQNAQRSHKNVAQHKKIPIGYYSLHDINSYPCEAGDPEKILNASTCIHNAHGQSIWNVHLESYASHGDFWNLYSSRYAVLLEKAASFLEYHSADLRRAGVEPKAAIFLSSGFDASEHETEHMQRHGVNVPTDFYARFTADVVSIAEKTDTGTDGRVISVLEGGYSDRALTSGVLSHLCGLTQNVEWLRDKGLINTPRTNGLTQPMFESTLTEAATIDTAWWSRHNLESLEAVVAGRLPQPPQQTNDKPPGSYSSPTQASTSRMTEIARERQSLNAHMEAKLWLENAPPDPVPEVDWTTAAYELSRLLIPDDRQTLSCTYEELNKDTMRAKRDRQSLNISTTSIDEKVSFRDRRTRQPVATTAEVKAVSRTSNRRTTIASAADLPDPLMSEGHQTRARRRSSAASSVLSSLQDLRLDDINNKANMINAPKVDPSASVKTPPVLPAKKTRAPSKRPISAQNSPRKGRSAAKLSSLSEVPSSNRATPATLDADLSRPSTSSAAEDGMDALTNGLKKISIKLKMPSEEQQDTNRHVTENLHPKTKSTRKPPVSRAARTKTALTKPMTAPSTEMNKRSTAAVTEAPAVQSSAPEKAKTSDETLPAVQPSALESLTMTDLRADHTSGAISTAPVDSDEVSYPVLLKTEDSIPSSLGET